MKSRGVAVVALLAALGPAAGAEDVSRQPASGATWNQWRGPNRDGRGEMFGTLERWPEKPAEVWRIDAGAGHASPVTDGARVYLFSRAGGDEVAAAYDLADGAELWSRRYPVSFRPRMGGVHHGAGPKSTPIVAGGRLVTFGITGVLSSWDAETGEPQWRIDFAEQTEKEPFPHWGTSFSPLVHGGRVIVHAGGESGALLALDAATGEVVWRHVSKPSYASPVLGRLGGREQLVTLAASGAVALSLEGEQLWSYRSTMTRMRQNVVTPVLIGAPGVGPSLTPGTERLGERVEPGGRGSGALAVIAGKRRPIIALRPAPSADGWRVEIAWRRDDLPMDMSTPVFDGERLCGLTHVKKGRAFCVDAGGEILWLGPPRFGGHASIVAVPGALLYLRADAFLVVLDGAGSAYRELARYQVADSETWAYPAVIKSGLVIKSRDRMARLSF